MGIGFWSKLKQGFKNFGKGVKKVWERVIKPVAQKLLPIAKVVAPAIGNAIAPGSGAAISAGLGVAEQFIGGNYKGAAQGAAGLAGVRLGDLASVKFKGIS